MPNSSTAAQNKRPTGVWILTIYALLSAGILPSLIAVFMLISGNSDGNTFAILLSLPISIGIIISAIGAWKGNNKSKQSLLILVTLHYAFIAINNYILINTGQVPDDEQARFWGRVIRGFIYPAVYIWYFNKPPTKIFYKLL